MKNMPIFSDSNTQTRVVQLCGAADQGQKVLGFDPSAADADLAWNFSLSARAGIVLGHNDSWGTYQSKQPTGALTIQ